MTTQIEAMKLALARLQARTDTADLDTIAALNEALAEQPAQQEPVAVVSGYYGGQCVILPINPARIFNSNTALYTSPTAQRKPLTDEQISAIGSKIFPSTWNIRHVDFARSIEAAHGIKENT